MKKDRFLAFIEKNISQKSKSLSGLEKPWLRYVLSSIPFMEFSLVTSLSNWLWNRNKKKRAVWLYSPQLFFIVCIVPAGPL